MKRNIYSLILFLVSSVFAFAQGFDITGTYLGETEGMAVRIDVQEYQGDQLMFSFIAREETGPVFSAAYSETGEYLFEEDGDRLQVTFEDDVCRVNNGDQTFPLVKISGDILSLAGSYAFRIEDDVELSLVVEDVNIEYIFTFEVWETENVLFAPMQPGTMFQLTSEWGDTVMLEFTPEQCLFSGESEGNIILTKRSSLP